MWRFLVTAGTLYALIQGYVAWKLAALFSPVVLWLLVPVCAILTALPFFRHRLSRFAGPRTSLVFVWMGAAWILCAAFVLTDAAKLVLRHLGFPLSAQTWNWLGLALGVTASIWAAYAARHPRIVRMRLEILSGSRPLRIAAFSDLHIGDAIRAPFVKRVVDLISAEKPDMVLLVGDIADGNMADKQEEAAMLASLSPACGKYAVLGNHEAYRGIGQSLDFFARCGVRVLRNEEVHTAGLRLVGVDDPACGTEIDHGSLLPKGRSLFTLALCHRPQGLEPWADCLDLQVSGHTHGGQIWPFHLATRLANKHPQGLSRVSRSPDSGSLYLLNGCGWWGPPFRLFAPPDILILDLVPGL